MKLFSVHTSRLQKGFTLIELLVVIGILGILAAALVATIDPFEQLRKGEDSRTQNTSVEFHNALIRYYTNHQNLPWEGTNPACNPLGGADDIPEGTTIEDLMDCVTVLIDEGELKEAFDTAPGLDEIFVTEPYVINGATTAEDSSPAVCYIPVAKSGKVNQNTRYDQDGAINAACPDEDDPNAACYWCAE